MTASNRQVGGDHYKRMDVQPWDVVDTWPKEQRVAVYRFGVLKYTMRNGAKHATGDAVEDAKKALHYAEKWVESLTCGDFSNE